MKRLTDPSALINSIYIPENGDARKPTDDDLDSKDGFIWLHMCAINPATRTFLHELDSVKDIMIDAMLDETTRPRLTDDNHQMLLVLRLINLTGDGALEDMISLRIWTDGRTVITTRRRDSQAVPAMIQEYEKGRGPRTAGEFLTELVSQIQKRIAHVLDEIEDKIIIAEESIARSEPDNACNQIAELRLRVALLRRHLVPQERALAKLKEADCNWISETTSDRLGEIHNKAVAMTELLGVLVGRGVILNDEIERLRDRKISRMTYLFSVAATIFLPLSFLTGLLGINVGGMPGADDGFAFWLVVVICAALGFILFRLFSQKDIL